MALKLSTPLPDGYQITAILDDLAKHRDREVAIVGASLAEATLARAVRSRFVSQDDHDRPFCSPGGAFSNLNALIAVAYHFGIVPKSLKLDLERIATIRNRFAHDFEDHSFDKASPACDFPAECQRLSLPDNFKEVALWVGEGQIKNVEDRNDFGLGLAVRDIEGFGLAAFFQEEDRTDNKRRFLLTIRLLHVIMGLHSIRHPASQ